MSLKRLFVVDKPHHAKCLQPVVEQFFSHDQISFLPLLTYGLHEFDFPRGLGMHNYPFAGYPRLKTGGAGQFLKESSIRERLEAADEIYFACSPDYTGVVSFYLTIAAFLGADKAQQKFPAIKLDVLNEHSIQDALLHCGSTYDDWCTELLRYGVAKRYIDYNFHVNSMGLFGLVLRHIGIDTQNFTMSKYALQLLYYMQKVKHIEHLELILAMQDWQGTGKYKQQASSSHDQPPMYREASLGSIVSRFAIIDKLIQVGLLHKDHKHIAISEKGQLFLSYVHPECYDPDLPFRLQIWCEDWDGSKVKVDRYLRTFFGRQKRFFQKKLDLEGQAEL